jgi:hypothetical protein
MRSKTKLDSHVEEKIRNVTKAANELQKVAGSKGRVAIRTARRSLWARIQALKEECDAQFVLPKRKSQLPPMSLKEKAQRYTVSGFDRALRQEIRDWIAFNPTVIPLSVLDYQGFIAAVSDFGGILCPIVLTHNQGSKIGTYGTVNRDGTSIFNINPQAVALGEKNGDYVTDVIFGISHHIKECSTARWSHSTYNKITLKAWEIFKSQEWRIT